MRRRCRRDAELVVTRNPPADRKTTLFADLIGAEDDAGVAAANAKVTPDTIAKFLFTSGSTGNPKGVINTQRMLCSNQAMIAAGFAFVQDEPPVVVDWLPWSHTFGSNHNFNLVLVNGGSLYIDDGNPTPPGVPKDRAQFARDRAHHLFQRAQGLRGAGFPISAPTRRYAKISSAG